MDVDLRVLRAEDLNLIGQVDRTEVNEAVYKAVSSEGGRGLTLKRFPLDSPQRIAPWTEEGIRHRIELWKSHVGPDGAFLGAFLDAKLVGFAVLGPVKNDESSELCALFVDSGHRRAGIGSQLLLKAEQVARRRGACCLWCGSNRTASAVEFYLAHGFRAISLDGDLVVQRRHGDPVFAKELRSNNTDPDDDR